MARRRTRKSSRSTSSSSARKSRKTSASRFGVRPVARTTVTDTLVSDIVREIVERLGLEDYNIKPEELMEVFRPIIESIVDQYSSRPSKEQILARLLRHQDKLLEIIAMHLLETREDLDEATLEFIIFNASGKALARSIPRLYQETRRRGREDLVDVLRGKWLESGYATPYQCPRCGFYALTPNFVCIVCGAEISEKEYKDFIGFRELLKQFVEEADAGSLFEILAEKRIAYDGSSLLPPSRATRDMLILSLSEDEIKVVEEAYKRKKGAAYGA